MPAFTPKAWQDLPTETTPVDAAALIDLETRLSGYTVAEIQALGALPTINAAAYGAVCNGQRVAQVTSTSASTTVSSPAAAFTSADVGKLALCYSDTAAGAITTIQSVVSATQITLAANAGITLAGASTGCFLIYGTDDGAAINAALTAAETFVNVNSALGYNEPFGFGKITVVIPAKSPASLCTVAEQINVPSGVKLDCQSMVANLQTDRYNPVILLQPYTGFGSLWVDALFGNAIQLGTAGTEADIKGTEIVVWQCGQGYDSGTGRYQDVVWLNGGSYMIDLIWSKGGYHTVRHTPGSDTIINRCDSIGALSCVSMSQTNQVRYGQLTMDSPGQIGGGTSGIVLDNACSDIVIDAQAFESVSVGTRSVDNVVLLGNGSTNKNVDIRLRISAECTGGAVINLQQAQDVQVDFIASNTPSNSSGSTAITTAVVFGTVAGSCDIRGQMNTSITPYSGTVGGRYTYNRNGAEYVVQSGGSPTAVAGAAIGTSPPTPTVTGNDARGYVAFGTGTSPTTGTAGTFTFNSATGYIGTPIVILTPRTAASAALQPYVTCTTSTFTVGFAVAPAASQAAGAYAFNYRVFG